MDTSVIVAASTPSDPRHEACLDALVEADQAGGACATHTLAEVFSIMTGRPLPIKMPPHDAVRLVAHVGKRFTTVSLSSTEYLTAIGGLANLGHSGGMIYDALLIACARKAKAARIYTLNRNHYRLVAPDLAPIILEP